MKFLSFKDKLDDLKNSQGAGEKFKNGARVLGTLVANTAIATGKITAELIKRLPSEMEKMEKKIEEAKAKENYRRNRTSASKRNNNRR